MVLTGVGAGDGSDVHGPAPARLVGHPADDRVVELDDVDPTARHGPHVACFTESLSLETHLALYCPRFGPHDPATAPWLVLGWRLALGAHCLVGGRLRLPSRAQAGIGST